VRLRSCGQITMCAGRVQHGHKEEGKKKGLTMRRNAPQNRGEGGRGKDGRKDAKAVITIIVIDQGNNQNCA